MGANDDGGRVCHEPWENDLDVVDVLCVHAVGLTAWLQVGLGELSFEPGVRGRAHSLVQWVSGQANAARLSRVLASLSSGILRESGVHESLFDSVEEWGEGPPELASGSSIWIEPDRGLDAVVRFGAVVFPNSDDAVVVSAPSTDQAGAVPLLHRQEVRTSTCPPPPFRGPSSQRDRLSVLKSQKVEGQSVIRVTFNRASRRPRRLSDARWTPVDSPANEVDGSEQEPSVENGQQQRNTRTVNAKTVKKGGDPDCKLEPEAEDEVCLYREPAHPQFAQAYLMSAPVDEHRCMPVLASEAEPERKLHCESGGQSGWFSASLRNGEGAVESKGETGIGEQSRPREVEGISSERVNGVRVDGGHG